MINRITISGAFAHANATFDFHSGLTTITGPNGRGKSEILTMIRFALFGSAALPTKVEDYKKTRVELDFTVRGIAHKVERSTSNAKLYREGDLVATGTRPVNAKIVETFGYGLAVFDTANVANQGLIEALGAMLPAERKRLVDSTIGLNVIDDLAKWCGEEANSLLAQRLVPTSPVEPERPEDYHSNFDAPRKALMELDAERADLERRIARLPPDPGPLADPRTLEELETVSSLNQTRADLTRRLDQFPVAQYTVDEIELWEKQIWAHVSWTESRDFLAKYPKPSMSKEELQEHLAYQERYDTWLDHEALKRRGYHTCPKCSHKWPVAAELQDVRDEVLDAPSMNSNVLHRMKQGWAAYDSSFPERLKHEPISPEPVKPKVYSLLVLQQERVRCENGAIRASLLKQLEELGDVEDVTHLIRARQAYDKRLQLPEWKTRLEVLQDVPERLADLISHQVACQTYDKLLVVYKATQRAYAEAMETFAALTLKAEEYQKAKLALIEIKTHVKSHLVPSLSKVASLILTRMTGGALSDVSIDADFDIRVDGKQIAGLSGAGKAAANLALRIGLGQVLTNKVFSLFMGDELDASMDEDRARFMAESLRNLSSTIGQIVLVSHKTPEADHYIRL